ncbi:hypothetical protein CCH79_00010282 [Gambusia affinis]|uniref:Uncharacterized protein n=1 Tax=Gambusia affinis TaxID=33528 RepID=A0A315VGL7_GAMAF|nr:hypothetical protein CCH79_00010282 [Gambusia affinis]
MASRQKRSKLPNFADFKVQVQQQNESITESSPTHQPQSPLWNLIQATVSFLVRLVFLPKFLHLAA